MISFNDLESESVGYAPWIEEVWYNYISNAIAVGSLFSFSLPVK